MCVSVSCPVVCVVLSVGVFLSVCVCVPIFGTGYAFFGPLPPFFPFYLAPPPHVQLVTRVTPFVAKESFIVSL